MDDIEEILGELRSAREVLNTQLLNSRGLRDLVISAPPEEVADLKAAYVIRVTDTINVLYRLNRAIAVLEDGEMNAMTMALLCLQGKTNGDEAPPISVTRH
jgi:hypothetical protein